MSVRKVVSLVIIVLLTLAVGYIGFFGIAWDIYEVRPFVEQVPKGLELDGGISILFEAKEGETVTAADMDAAADIARKRLEGAGYADSSVVRVGEDAIRADISIGGENGQVSASYLSQYISEQAKLEYKDPDGNVIFDNSGVRRAFVQVGQQSSYDLSSTYVVGFSLKPEAVNALKQAAGENAGGQFSVELNGQTIAQPYVDAAAVGNEVYLDTGSFTAESASLLVHQINSGVMPVAITLSKVSNIGPTTGVAAAQAITAVFGAALALVCVLFLLRYRLAGLIADLSLLIFVLVYLMSLATIPGIRLNLPGAAGVLLSLALASASNGLLLACLRKEILLGKTVRTAAKTGFSEAFTPIFNAHFIVLLLALTLLFAGNDPVRNFAGAFAVGTVYSFLQALVTRGLFGLLMGFPAGNKKLYVSRRAVTGRAAQ
ncbi:MAG TPA: hypothetical protein VN366_08225 [Feifaniaceae bacterium]|nr:hypothetical protein [Feifaniaceae bacterium]